MAGTLEGIKILELSSFVTGPFASMLMADLGAEVIKVEDREKGDPFRGWGERLYFGHLLQPESEQEEHHAGHP